MKKVLLIVSLLCLFSCTKTNEEIVTSYKWKYGGGYRVGDWIDFSTGMCSYSNDAIFKKGIAVGLVGTITKHYGEYRLHVKPLIGDEEGLYIEKGETK